MLPDGTRWPIDTNVRLNSHSGSLLPCFPSLLPTSSTSLAILFQDANETLPGCLVYKTTRRKTQKAECVSAICWTTARSLFTPAPGSGSVLRPYLGGAQRILARQTDSMMFYGILTTMVSITTQCLAFANWGFPLSALGKDGTWKERSIQGCAKSK